MRDVAVVSFAQSPSVRIEERSEVQMIVPVIAEALSKAGLSRKDIGFTCSGSADYLSGTPFAFVGNLEATGAWPPIEESHVEMDGAWALYEAWVRLQHGDIDTALVFASGKSSQANLREVLTLQLDPYYLEPLWIDSVSMAALQANAYLERSGRTERDLAEVAARSRKSAINNPNAQVSGDEGAEQLLNDPYVVAPLRKHACPPISDGAAAIVLAAEGRAKDLCERPAWIRGIDHRIDVHYPGLRDLTVSDSARLAGEKAGLGNDGVQVAELSAPFAHQELILREAFGFGSGSNGGGGVEINPSGGALVANPIVATGLIRIGEAAASIMDRGKTGALAHATSGPCLQQNLVCILEGE